MRIKITNLEPSKASIYFFKLPLSIIAFLLITLAIWPSLTTMTLLFGTIFLFGYIDFFWRLRVGVETFRSSPSKKQRTLKYRIFLCISISNFLVLPVLFLSLYLIFNDYTAGTYLLLGSLVYFGPIASIWLCDFIAENLALIEFGKSTKRRFWSITWGEIWLFGWSAKRTQKTIIEIMKKANA